MQILHISGKLQILSKSLLWLLKRKHMIIREMSKADIAEVYSLRMITRENTLTREELEKLGITENSVSGMLRTSHRGWVCVESERMVGFAIGNHILGEMWVIAIHPDFEEKGIGKALITYVQDWLWEKGWDKIWLTTDIDTTLRAYGFYKKLGWEDQEIKDGMRYMQLVNPKQKRHNKALHEERVKDTRPVS